MNNPLLVAFKVYYDIHQDSEILGVFDDPEKIKKAFGRYATTKEYAIGYGPTRLNKPLSLKRIKWRGWKWLKDI